MPNTAKNKLLGNPLEEALAQAEEDHYRDCPNAELSIRFAALMVDVILSYLADTGLQHVCSALNMHMGHLESFSWAKGFSPELLHYLSQHSGMISAQLLLMLKLGFFYFYFVWSLVFSGGTPGKLLMGIRVLDEQSGKNLSLGQALLRSLVGMGLSTLSLGFGFILAVIRKDKRALHDLLAGSVVKRIHGAR